MKNFVFCQNDSHKGASYETYSMEKETKYGFVCIALSFDFVSHVSFNSVDELTELMCCDDLMAEMYDELETMAVGESTNIGDETWVRVW